MTKFVVLPVAALAFAGAAPTALAGVPAWCKDASFASDRYDLKDLSARDPRDVIITFAKAVCAPTPEAEAGAGEIEKARQAWSKKLNMTEAAVLSQSRKAFEGCEDKTAAALAAEVAKVPARTFAGMKDVRDNPYKGFAAGAGPALVTIPAINLAAMPYVLCHSKSGTADFLAAYLQDTAGYRGPRTTALTRIIAEKITLDDMNARVEYPTFSSRPYWRSHGTIGSAGGVVATVKPADEVLNVDLEKTLVKRKECIKSHSTHRISRILADGKIEYEEICDQTGMVSHDTTWGTFKIKKEFASLLKKGIVFSSVGGQDKGADVIAIWPSKTAELPSQVLGAAVK